MEDVDVGDAGYCAGDVRDMAKIFIIFNSDHGQMDRWMTGGQKERMEGRT